MSDPRLKRIQDDLYDAPTVIYFEGKTDPDIVFALLGVKQPRLDHDGVLVVGLDGRGSGNSAVAGLTTTAAAN
ncbi:MAG: hypothetical protein ACOYOB_20760, partial [Myxococcota bacterium]